MNKNKIKKIVLNIFYPARCPVCGRILKDNRRSTCPECKDVLKPVNENFCLKCGLLIDADKEYCMYCDGKKRLFMRGRGTFLYNDRMKRSLLEFKYSGRREYADYYARSMVRYLGREIKSWKIDVIVPVPLSKHKYRTRGFNQAADLAIRIGKLMNIPVSESVDVKVHDTKSQKKLDAVHRRENLKGAFKVTCSLSGLNVLIVDDVYTTGSTIESLAEQMLQNGAGRIYFATLCIGAKSTFHDC